MEAPPLTLAVILNPHTCVGPCRSLAERALAALRAGGALRVLETRGDARDGDCIQALVADGRLTAVVAAGGDGTVREVAAALLRLPSAARPPLAILPLGTANNVARALGLLAFGQRGDLAVERAVGAIRAGERQPLDLGEVDGRCFVGSFAVGMDGAILAARNRWRTRFRLGRTLGGYPLYLLSCAVNLLHQRPVRATLRVDGVPGAAAVHDLLVTNTALYAGEFRFDGDQHSADGRLDLHVFGGPVDYVRGFVAAWRRHLRQQRGDLVQPPAHLRRVERVEIALDTPLPSQLDGEQGPRADRFSVRVLPQAIRVCVGRAEDRRLCRP